MTCVRCPINCKNCADNGDGLECIECEATAIGREVTIPDCACSIGYFERETIDCG